jgi:uncharacterized repeat protein (TIGR03803 family)
MRARRNTCLAFIWILSTALAACLPTAAAAQTPSAPVFTVVSDIPAVAGISNPGAQTIVQGRSGRLYSTAQGGEDTAVYSLTLGGTDTKVVDTGNRGNGGGVTLGADGNFYGTSDNTGSVTCGLYGCGILWRATPSGVLTTLYNFQGTNGCTPLTAPVQAPSGIFYGTTPYSCNGVNNVGVIYSFTSGGVYKVLHTLSGADGAYPHAPLTVGPDGNLYGGTSQGGNNNYGVLFRITPSGTYTVLHYFAGSDGYDVESGMTVGRDGNLYGTTNRGGGGGVGVIFKLTTSGTYAVINPIPQPSTGPGTSLVQGTDGKFYGILNTGSSGNNGVLYSVTTTGTLTRLHSFCQQTKCTDGWGPSTPLVQATDGKFYGVTSDGGTPSQCNSGNGCGVFYSFDVGLGAFINLGTYSGNIGSTVGIFGQGFDSASVVKFNGVKATKITLSGTTYITATVPAGATDGRVTVTTGTTTLTSTSNFIVHNTWSKGKAMPTAVVCPAVGYINGKIYVVGGGNGTSAVSTNQVYTFATNTWSTAKAMPTPVGCAAYAVVNGILYVIGGSNGPTPMDLVQAYDPATNTWSTKTPMPTARASIPAAVVDGATIYVMGGNGSTPRLDTVEKYDTTTDTWSSEAPMSVGRSETTGALLGTTIVSSDGNLDSGPTGDTEAYDISTNTWTDLTADPTPRGGPCFGALSGQLYLAGGNNQAGGAIAVTESFSLSTKKWTTHASIPTAVMWPGSVGANGQLYCFGGTPTTSGATADSNVQIYQP